MSEFNTPWKVKESSFNYKTCIDDCDGYFTAQVVLNNADLRHAENTTNHIVKCVNEHEVLQSKADMCDSLAELLEDTDVILEDGDIGGMECMPVEDCHVYDKSEEFECVRERHKQALKAYNELKGKNDECIPKLNNRPQEKVLYDALLDALDSIQYATDYIAGGSLEMEQHGVVKELRAYVAKIRAILNEEKSK